MGSKRMVAVDEDTVWGLMPGTVPIPVGHIYRRLNHLVYSIWFFHAAYGREGENPELRTMFFRLARLLTTPILPVFVFDGPKRPSFKRGKRIGGKQHWLTDGMKNIIGAFGFEWRQVECVSRAMRALELIKNIVFTGTWRGGG